MYVTMYIHLYVQVQVRVCMYEQFFTLIVCTVQNKSSNKDVITETSFSLPFFFFSSSFFFRVSRCRMGDQEEKEKKKK